MKVQSTPVHLHIKLNRICAICARIENLCYHLYRVFSPFFVLHQSSFLTSNFTHLPRSLHYMPYFTAHVILLFRVTSADKRVALYLRISLHYLMCVASCNIRLFVYTYFMYSIEEKCRIFSYPPPNKACISSGSTVQEMIGLHLSKTKKWNSKASQSQSRAAGTESEAHSLISLLI